ncbi:MAG: DNA replication/repair protein RecF [Pseudomonadales bacterium]
MTLRTLAIRDCRNLAAVDIELSPGLNLFVGPNGAGKTALLEAVHVLARGRSFRAAQASKVIRHDQAELIVRALLVTEAGSERTIAIGRPRRGPIKVHVDGEPVRGIAEISRLLAVQVMLPGVSDLIFAGPSERRRWLDWGVFHVKPTYIGHWRRYNQLLKQRNSQLKHQAGSNDQVLLAFTDGLIRAAEPLSQDRADYIQRWEPWFRQVLLALDPELAAIGIELAPNGRVNQSQSQGESFADILSQNLSRDVKLGVTHNGPHRLELSFTIDGRPASERLSRGQGKTLALAMQISQAELLVSETGQSSVFLIDDAGAELDHDHNAAFFEAMAATGAQVLATCTTAPWTGSAYAGEKRTVFHVKQGQIEAQ